MRINKYLVILGLFTMCIDPVAVETSGRNPNQLVVEGEINNLPGPYTVRLSYATINLSNEIDFARTIPVTNATVNIVNQTDELTETLIYNGRGEYQTDPNSLFRGEVGKTYYLQVLINGEEFISKESTIMQPVDIDFLSLGFNSEAEQVEVYVNLRDPEEERNIYRWTWNAWRQIRTILPPIEGTPTSPGNPDTVECCATCYLAFDGNEINLFQDQFINGGEIRNQVVTSFTVRRPVEFLVEVQQSVITEETYEFFSLLEEQLQNEGGLFDPPPYRIRGNMSKVNSDELVLGYFSANGAVEDFIQFSGGPYTDVLTLFEGTEDDCRLIVGTDTLRPENWR